VDQNSIKYTNKDFNSLKDKLKELIKVYFPNTYNDFGDSNPGEMFLDLDAYVGDILSFYQDTQIQENLLQYAQENESMYSLSQMFGYKPKTTTAAQTILDTYQLLPAISSGSVTVPDFRYALIVQPQASIKSNVNSNVNFLTQNVIDFNFSSSYDPTEISVYSTNNISNQPNYYLLKKKTKAISGTIKTQTFNFGVPERYATKILNDNNIIQILDVIDSNGNNWYEVPFLGQETIFEEIQNIPDNDPILSQYRNTAPYLIRLKKVSRRFVTRVRADNTIEMKWGAGISVSPDEEIIPNPDNVGIGLADGISKLDYAYDPSNFLYTGTYGISPSNTTLTVRYIVGGGVESNANIQELTEIDNINIINQVNLNATLLNQIRNSIAFSNSVKANGGKGPDTIDEIRENAMASFAAQQRAVTDKDYIVRALSMPAKYGSVSKVFIIPDEQLNVIDRSSLQQNPLAMNMYVLGYDQNNNLTNTSVGVKENLKTYLNQYRILTDSINIRDAFIINIQVFFDIVILPTYGSSEVLLNCITTLKDYFNINKWTINQPLLIKDIINKIASVKGVQSVINLRVENIFGEEIGYSIYSYNIASATARDIIYPSLDPSIFEVKYPDNDLIGRVVSY
jgi:hypothetical protein